jgi:hypothetical protein
MMPDTQSLKIPPIKILSLIFFTKMLDLVTTYFSMSRGFGYEANPVTAYFLNLGGFPLLICFSYTLITMVVVVLILSQWFVDKYNGSLFMRKLVRFSIFACIGLNVIVVINNLLVIYFGYIFTR